jgi:hypothetical protein
MSIQGGILSTRMLPPVPPSVAGQQAQHREGRQVPPANGAGRYRVPEGYHHATQRQIRTPAGSYSQQPLSATTSKSPLSLSASPKQGYEASAPVMGTFNRVVPTSYNGSPRSAHVSPVSMASRILGITTQRYTAASRCHRTRLLLK